MNKDNGFLFRVIYFLTAMSPSYILMVVKYFSLDELTKSALINKLILLILCISFTFLVGYLLKRIIERDKGAQRLIMTYNYSLISETNKGVLSFLDGIILLTLINIGSDKWINIIMFALFQALIYKLSMNSGFVCPNAILILMGYNLIKIDDKYILINDKFIDKNGKAVLACINKKNNLFVMEELDG